VLLHRGLVDQVHLELVQEPKQFLLLGFRNVGCPDGRDHGPYQGEVVPHSGTAEYVLLPLPGDLGCGGRLEQVDGALVAIDTPPVRKCLEIDAPQVFKRRRVQQTDECCSLEPDANTRVGSSQPGRHPVGGFWWMASVAMAGGS